MTRPNDDSAKLAAVRDVLSAFDWERDDRQYALEEIERIVTAQTQDTSHPAAFTLRGGVGEVA